jgi:type I restriction enzyme S subunit
MKGMISKGEFQKIEFLCPAPNEQRKYGEIFEQDTVAGRVLREALDSSADLFGALSQRAFRGEL